MQTGFAGDEELPVAACFINARNAKKPPRGLFSLQETQ
jgi:hypothetical protein